MKSLSSRDRTRNLRPETVGEEYLPMLFLSFNMTSSPSLSWLRTALSLNAYVKADLGH